MEKTFKKNNQNEKTKNPPPHKIYVNIWWSKNSNTHTNTRTHNYKTLERSYRTINYPTAARRCVIAQILVSNWLERYSRCSWQRTSSSLFYSWKGGSELNIKLLLPIRGQQMRSDAWFRKCSADDQNIHNIPKLSL